MNGADFKNVLIPEHDGKQNPKESYMNKYQKHVAFSYGYKLVCVDDKFDKRLMSYLSEDAVYNFIDSMIKESKHFSKELAMTKEYNKDFEDSTKCQICDNDYADNENKARDHCVITGKYSVPVYRNFNINVKLNHKIPVVFQVLKKL